MNNIQDISKDNEIKSLLDLLKDKINKENLLKNNKINPFNLMMTLSTLRLPDEEIWTDLLLNVIKSIQNEKFVINTYLLSDIVYGFGTYETAILPSTGKQAHKDYIKNRIILWQTLETLFLKANTDQFAILQTSNIAWYFSQLGIVSNKVWETLIKLVLDRLKDFDSYNFILCCMAFSTIEIQTMELWRKLEEKAIQLLNILSLDDIRKLIFSFLKIKECKDIWVKIDEYLASEKIIKEYNLMNFADLQLPLAVTEINNPKIWNKFEEIVFKNLETFEKDNDLLMNTVYSFSKLGQGSKLFWENLTKIVYERLDNYDPDDLGHIAVCLNKIVTDEKFWDRFTLNVEQKLANAKLNASNNLLKGFTSNDYLKKNQQLAKKIDEKVQTLLKEINK